jgi:hypothetical protein
MLNEAFQNIQRAPTLLLWPGPAAPTHPYTRTLLLSAPVADVAEQRRRRERRAAAATASPDC